MSHPEAMHQRQALGPYQLGLLLGQGGMGKVYKAFDDRLGRFVAVKYLRSGATAEARQRLRHEARALAQLGHPGIVRIFDIVEDAAGDGIVMELIDGPTLAELCRCGPIDVGLALDYARQIASALGAAHASRIVHRDLKTENVMVLASGHVRVLDFGLARPLGPRPAGPRSAGPRSAGPRSAGPRSAASAASLEGTPRSMSPEQARGREIDARSDLFSFGVLLYEILTARSPFAARTTEETLRRVIHHVPPPARQLQARMPRLLSELIGRLLEKDPSARPPSAEAVEAELVTIAARVSASRLSTRRLSAIEIIDEKADEGEAVPDEVVVTTLLVSDLVGSTQLVEELGDRDAAALFKRHDRLARDLLEQHGGREIDKADGFLLLFEHPWRALRYALACHERLADLGLTARVGIHLGEVILHRHSPADVGRGAKPIEVVGLAKPLAARLMSLAAGGQTLLTRPAWEAVRRTAESGDGGDFAWRSHGSYHFQGIGDDVEVFEVGDPVRAPLIAPAGSQKVRRVGEASASFTADAQPVGLRFWPPPELPEQPYPVLLPYTHPALLAGREAEISRLRRLLELPVPLLGLAAPSGTGKSSLLVGGLVPELRAAGHPVALVRHPAEIGVASRLIGDLLDGAATLDDFDAAGFIDRLAEAERLSGRTPVLVLDQFDDVLREDSSEARAVLGSLLAASSVRRSGLAAPPCRWLIAYREELFGRLSVWLGDVLAEARQAGRPGIEALPHDLSQPERFHSMPLAPLATPPSGTAEPLSEASRTFLAAIEKPLEIPPRSPHFQRGEENPAPPSEKGGSGGIFPWYFPPGHAERLARAFAETRLARPDAPLAPELQVTLAHLLDEAGPDGRIEIGVDPGPLIAEALEEHLRRALEAAFPAADAASATRRARALLALRELASASEGLRPGELARAIGEDGEAILERLATPSTRLVVVREAVDGPRFVLAHDRMTAAVVRLVEEEGRHGRLVIDTELLALRRFVTLRTALYRSREAHMATRVPRRALRRIEENAAALLWDEDRRSWLAACRARQRRDQRRFWGVATLALLLFVMVGWSTWSSARRLADQRALRAQVVEGEPDAAFRAFDQLATLPRAEAADLLALLRRRQVPMDVLERGLGALGGPARSAAVLRTVEITLPWVEETPRDPVLIANLVWALDYAPGRNPAFVQKARVLRDRVLEPLRRSFPPPPIKESQWVVIPPGRFLMGTAPGQPGRDDERPQHEVTISAFRMMRHEVTNADFRRLVPDHDPTAGEDLPAAFITWYAAYTYAAWLGGRLPTEAEWEYAARAGCRYDYCDRHGEPATVDAVAWTVRTTFDANGEVAPRPVMSLEPNPWGLYDLLGNLWEWTADGYAAYPDRPRSDPWVRPSAAPGGGGRVNRGGDFRFEAIRSRPADRDDNAPADGDEDRGFRVVLPGRS